MKRGKPSYRELQLKLNELETKMEHISEHAEKMKQAFFHTPVATSIFDKEGNLTDCNPACLSLLGIERLDPIRRFNLFALSAFPSEYKIEIESGKEIQFEFIIDFESIKKTGLCPTTKSGQSTFNCTIQPFPLATQNNNAYLVLFNDKTEQKKNRLELEAKNKQLEEKNNLLNESLEKMQNINAELRRAKESTEVTQAHLQLIADNLPMFVSHIDQDFKYLFANQYYLHSSGLNPKEMVGRTVKEVFGEGTFQNALPYLKRALSGEMVNYENKLSNGCNDLYLNSIYIPNRLDEKKNSLFVLGYDITDRKKAELEMIAAKEHAEESDKLKGAFLQNISHEIRTPLNAIDGFAQLIASGQQSESNIRKFSNMITTNSEKLIEIVTDMILISQIQAKQITTKRSTVEFIELMNEIVNGFAEKAKEKKINLSFINNIDTEKLLLDTDSKKIRKIFSHIIDNALKFTSMGYIQISCMLECESIKVSVTDTGIGISEEQQRKIFDPFWQVEGGTSRNYGGNGLGLSIAKAFTLILGGSISVLSAPGVGSCFDITLPLSTEKE